MFTGLGFLFLITDHASAGLPPCIIGIEKAAMPVDGTEFNFSITGFVIGDFGLTSGSSNNINLANNEEITVTEEVPQGWVLDDIICSDPIGIVITNAPNGRTFQCTATTAVGITDCTFFNIMEPPPPTQPPPTQSPVTGIPSLNEWGLLSLAVVLGLVGIVVFRLRRKTA